MHAGINKYTGVPAVHVKKHLGAVCVCVCVYGGILAFVYGRTHPHHPQKLQAINPLYV